MTVQDLQQLYVSKAQWHKDEIQRLKLRNRGFISGEIISFVAFVGFIVAYVTVDWGLTSVLLSVLSLILYIAIRYIDMRNSTEIDRLDAKLRVYQKELKYLSGDFTCFGDGARYVDSGHPFTFDMDVFGHASLFNRINRTVTTGGSDYLAECLGWQHEYNSSEDIENINRRRAAVDRIANLERLRTEFMSYGNNDVADTSAVLCAVGNIASMSVPAFAVSRLSLCVAGLSLIVFFTLILLSIFTSLSGNIPVMWGILQFFAVFMVCSKPLREISKVVNSLHGHLATYIKLIRLIAGSELSDIADRDLCLEKSGDMSVFDGLKAILDGLDRRGNVLGLMVFDTFLLSDFFLVRRFAKWKNNNIETVRQWIDTVSVIDALISMATFRYNEPQSVNAVIIDSDEVVYDVKGLYHPFIGTKAVHNDFNIINDNYYIITGANMAGKSTFLRSLGINYILAMNGMPVFADSLRISVFSLFSSMRTTDDLTQGISYFNAELLRLKLLLDECGRRKRTLIILDEILKGTNSLDKLNGSRLFLNEITAYPVTGIIATHDLELSKMADDMPDTFHNYCFEIKLAEKITYTYKITPGVARNQNATYLLKNIINGVCQ